MADISDNLDGSHLRTAYFSIMVKRGTPTRIDWVRHSDGPRIFVMVDSATISMCDADALRAVPEEERRAFLDRLVAAFFSHGSDQNHETAALPLPGAIHSETIIESTTGWGDGTYPMIHTIDRFGHTLAIHIDFLISSGDPEPNS